DGSQTYGSGNDVLAYVAAVGGGGTITTLTIVNDSARVGTPPALTLSYSFGPSALTFSGGSGTDFAFNINRSIGASASYSIQISANGTGYNTADTLVITGNKVGGATTAND